jgi:hypothetical protein
MNPFWKTILTTVLGAASVVGARYSADWVANHTYRADRPAQAVAQTVRPVYVPTHTRVTVPNYFRRSTTPRSFHRTRMRH